MIRPEDIATKRTIGNNKEICCIHRPSMAIYNEICDLIANNVSKEYAIFREPEIEINGERRKPDMVIKDHEKGYVVDVTVRYENNDSLMKAYKENETTAKEMDLEKLAGKGDLVELNSGIVRKHERCSIRRHEKYSNMITSLRLRKAIDPFGLKSFQQSFQFSEKLPQE
ncbi:reverse transcriptase [Apis cerana cerana]|uniref:Reverse transcriptase n=1 Tax=Apis cerana cerana TaxID=94128 RepID=A0A2A3E033_APICC|nr:reverse transcriptase [Apis cerana cerana]